MSNVKTIATLLEREFTATSVRCPHPECQWVTDIRMPIKDTAPELVEAEAGKLAHAVFRDLVDHMRYFHKKHVSKCSGYDECTCVEHQRDLPDVDADARAIVSQYYERKQAKRAASVQAMLDGKAFSDKVANAIRSVINPEVHYDPDGIREDIGYVFRRDDIASRIVEELGDQGLLRERPWVSMTPNGGDGYLA